MMNRRMLPGVLSLLLVALVACRDDSLTTSPVGSAQPIISDAANGGSAGFYFLPPLVPKPAYAGTFDPGASPTVQVCNDAACSSIHAAFTMTSGTGAEVVRVDAASEQYIVNWNAGKTDAVPGKTYRLRVLVDDVVAGFTDVVFLGSGKNARNAATDEAVVLINGNTMPIKFRLETGRTGPETQPSQPVTCLSCLEIVPGGVLLTGSGAQQQLKAYRVDAQGNRTPASATFTSSDPANITVTTSGLLTAVVDVGSSQIVAVAGPDVSAPVLAIVAEPVAGALLITDEQVEGDPTPVDPAASQIPGWQYHIRLRGVTPAVGQVIISVGFAPVQGKVISVTPGSGGLVDVVLELLKVNELFVRLEINQHITMTTALPTALRKRSSLLSPSARSPLTGQMNATNARIVRTLVGPRRDADAAKVEFDLGPFSCEAELGVGASFPLTFDLATFNLNPDWSLDYMVENAQVTSIIVHLSLSPQIELSPRLTAAVKGKVECKGKAAKPISPIILPITGALSPLWGAFIEIGAGAGLEASIPIGDVGFDAFAQANVAMDFGVACVLGNCQTVSDLQSSSGGSFRPVFPTSFSLDAELGASFFAYASLKFGSPTVDWLQYELLSLKAGLKQDISLRSMSAQALDPTYASKFQLSPFLEVEAGQDIQEIAKKLDKAVALPSFSADLSAAAVSPSGTLTIEPDNVDPGTANSLGELATFTVDLTHVSYLGGYSIDKVEIRWLKTDENGNKVLDPGRPGCTDIAVTSSQQATFTCSTDFLDSHIGDHEFFAFVHSKLFGVSVPIPLEIGVDGKAKLKVERSGTVRRRSDFTTGAYVDFLVINPDSLTASGGNYVGTGTAALDQLSISTNAGGCTFHTTALGSGMTFTVSPHPTLSGTWQLNALISGNSTSVSSCDGVTNVVPFSSVHLLGNGKEIRRNGVLVGFDFNVSASGPTFTNKVTGKLKIK